MVNIIKALGENEKEAIAILSKLQDKEVVFTEWDDDEEEYSDVDDCPYIRYANDEGEITTFLVVAARYNDEKKRIEILATESEATKTDGFWFSLHYADDISYWQVLDSILELEA